MASNGFASADIDSKSDNAVDTLSIYKGLVDVLKCPVCLQFPSGRGLTYANICKNGHFVCGVCSGKLEPPEDMPPMTKLCPTCRDPDLPPHSLPHYLLNSVLGIVSKHHLYACENDGCEGRFRGVEQYVNHLTGCHYRTVSCPLKFCRDRFAIRDVEEHDHFEIVYSRYLPDRHQNEGDMTHVWDFVMGLDEVYDMYGRQGTILAKDDMSFAPRLLRYSKNDKMADDLNNVPYVGAYSWGYPDIKEMALYIGWLDPNLDKTADYSVDYNMVVNSYLERRRDPEHLSVDLCTNLIIEPRRHPDQCDKEDVDPDEKVMTCKAHAAAGMDSALAEILVGNKQRRVGRHAEEETYTTMLRWNVRVREASPVPAKRQRPEPLRPRILSQANRSRSSSSSAATTAAAARLSSPSQTDVFPIVESGSSPTANSHNEGVLIRRTTRPPPMNPRRNSSMISSSSSAQDQSSSSGSSSSSSSDIEAGWRAGDSTGIAFPLVSPIGQGGPAGSVPLLGTGSPVGHKRWKSRQEYLAVAAETLEDASKSKTCLRAIEEALKMYPGSDENETDMDPPPSGWRSEQTSVKAEVDKPVFVFANQSAMPDRYLYDFAMHSSVARAAMLRNFLYIKSHKCTALRAEARGHKVPSPTLGRYEREFTWGVLMTDIELMLLVEESKKRNAACRACGRSDPHLHVTVFGTIRK